jgi:hypothetical protein
MPTQQASVTNDSGRILVEAAVIERLTHLAVGNGPVVVTGGVLQPPPRAAAALQSEIGRARFLERLFVVEDNDGPLGPFGSQRYSPSPSQAPTNLIFFRFRFQADEGLGNWSEFGIFGDGVAFISKLALLLDGAQAGDDRANLDVSIAGDFVLAVNQTITVTVSTPGGDGVAAISWVSSDPASLPAGGPVIVDFRDPVPIGASGLALVFSGGVDGVLTLGDSWNIHCTTDPDSPTYASGGAYSPALNPDGQVKIPGRLFRLYHRDPPLEKPAVILDVELVTEVLNDA